MLIHRQNFWEKYTGIKHTTEIAFDYRANRKCYDVLIDGEFYATAEHRCGAFDELVDVLRQNPGWSPLNSF